MDELLTPGGRRDVANVDEGDDEIPVTPSTRKDSNNVESKVGSGEEGRTGWLVKSSSFFFLSTLSTPPLHQLRRSDFFSFIVPSRVNGLWLSTSTKTSGAGGMHSQGRKWVASRAPRHDFRRVASPAFPPPAHMRSFTLATHATCDPPPSTTLTRAALMFINVFVFLFTFHPTTPTGTELN